MTKEPVKKMDEDFGNPMAYSKIAILAIQAYFREKMKSPDQLARRKIAILLLSPIETVNEYLSCSDFFENSTLEYLEKAKLNKKQYQIILKVVQRVGLKFYQYGLRDEEIRPWVTKLVKGMLSEHKKHGGINRKDWTLEWESRIGYKKKDVKELTKSFRAPPKKSFSYQPGVTKALYGPKTVEQIQDKFDQVIEELSELPVVNAASVDFFRNGLVKALGDIGSISVALKDIEKETFEEDERWAI